MENRNEGGQYIFTSESFSGASTSVLQNVQKLSKLPRRSKIYIGTVITLLVIVVSAYLFIFHQNVSLQQIENQAFQEAATGRYVTAANKLIVAYGKTSSNTQKANLSYNIGLFYYSGGNPTLGKRWLMTSIVYYRKAGQTTLANNISSIAERLVPPTGASSTTNMSRPGDQDYDL